MREDLQRLKNSVEGRTVFILGGGPSVTPEILQTLNNRTSKVFCLNSSAKAILNPLGLMWCDESWAGQNLDYVNTLKCPKFYVKHNGQTHIQKGIYGIGRSTILHKSGDFGLDPDVNNVRGNNSGANAINLLINCKAAQIGLIGFDMNVAKNNVAHFHRDYTYAIRPSVYKDLFIPSIESMKESMDAAGTPTKVFNCNKFSALKCFEYKELEKML